MDITLWIHVAGGAVALLMGGIALLVRKGGKYHKTAGYWFVGAMVVMAVPGGFLSYVEQKPFDMLSSVFAVYMVLTGWFAFTRPDSRAVTLMLLGSATCVCGYLYIEIYAQLTGVRATDAPNGAGYVFATILGLALLGDLRLNNRFEDRRRMTIRHMWRLNFGLFAATASFFGARPHLFPDWMQAYGVLLLLSFAPILLMGYWRVKLRQR